MIGHRTVSMAALLAALALGMSLAPAAAQPRDGAAVVDAYTAAINAGDVEGALAFVYEHAIYVRPAGAFVGKGEVRGFVEDLVTRGARIELIGERSIDGEWVRWRSRVSLADPANPGGPRLVVNNRSSSIIRDGLIVFHQAMPAADGD